MCDHVGRSLAGRTPGVALNDEGVIQANRLAERMVKEPVQAIYASPLERAVDSAVPTAMRLGLPITPSEALMEIDYGDWTGRSISELNDDPAWQQYNTFRSGTRIPSGDFIPAVQARVARELESLRRRHRGQSVALFSHADIIRAALSYLLAVPVDHMLRLEIDSASISAAEVADWGIKVHTVNDTAHLR
jgi:probable phosphoglycerate mutase